MVGPIDNFGHDPGVIKLRRTRALSTGARRRPDDEPMVSLASPRRWFAPVPAVSSPAEFCEFHDLDFASLSCDDRSSSLGERQDNDGFRDLALALITKPQVRREWLHLDLGSPAHGLSPQAGHRDAATQQPTSEWYTP